MTEPRDEKHPPDESEATTQPVPGAATPEPPAAEPTPEPTPEPAAEAAAEAAPTGPTGPDRVAAALRSRWLPPLATGLAGLLLGLMIGAVGMGLFAALLHGPRGHHGPRDFHGPGHHWQDDRPVPPRR